MRFYKLTLLTLCVAAFTGLAVVAADKNQEWDVEDLRKLSLQKQKQVLDSGMLDDISEKATETHKNYEAAARMARTRSLLDMRGSMVDYGLASEDEANAFTGDQCEAGEGGDDSSCDLDSNNPRENKHIYVSFSMSESELLNVFHRAYQQDAAVFFKGMKPGMKMLDDMAHAIGGITKKMDGKIPPIRFNPEGFDIYGVENVPTIIYFADGRYTKAEGIVGFEFLQDRHDGLTENTNLGKYGETRKVIERDLLEEIKERYAALDGDKLRDRAINQFWQKQKFSRLPESTKSNVHFIDPTVKVSKDIVNPAGQVLARAGTVINPLAQNAMNSAYVVINPNSVEQTNWALTWLEENKRSFHTVMVIATEINKDKGWDHLTEVRELFKQEIYILPEEMKNRFSIVAVPTVVSTDLTRMVLRVEQIKIGEDE